jgi:glycosyl transferase, family 25
MDGFEVLNRFFDRIIVISLRRATERHARLRERLAGLNYEIHWGTDAAEMDLAELERSGAFSEARARRVHRNGKLMAPGHLGCSFSHRGVWEAVVRNGWKRVLIFEDDVLPRPEARSDLVATALGELPEDWDLVYLGYEQGEVTRARDRVKQGFYLVLASLRLIKWTPRQVLGLHPTRHSTHLRRAGKHYGAHAYGVTQRCARLLLEAQTPVAWMTDQLLLHLCMGREVEGFHTDPKLFDQDSLKGTTATYTVPAEMARRRWGRRRA